MTVRAGTISRRRLAGGALVLSMLLAACGGTSSPQAAPAKPKVKVSATKIVLDSVRTTADARTARMAMRASVGGVGQGFGFTIDGVTSFDSGDSDFNMNVSGAGAAMLSGGLEMRTVDGKSYMHVPAGFPGAGGDTWFEMPSLGAGLGGLPGAGETDPTKFLASLEKVASGVTAVGSESIRGVETTHYKATLDLGKAVDGADVPPALKKELDGLGTKLPPMPVDVWVDGSGLLRRIDLSIDLSAFEGADTPSSGAPSVVAVQLDLYDFGVPVDVQAPPADQVTQFPSLGDLGNLGGPSGASGSSGAAL